MSRFARKIKKFVKSPGVFFRDYFLLRAPLGLSADINRPRKHDAEHADEAGAAEFGTGMETLLDGFIQPGFPVDIVYTWVDADDPDFAKQRAQYLSPDSTFQYDATCEARFISRDELRYSLRSIVEYAPWVRKIFIVTNGQVPSWLDTSNERVQVITHDEIIPKEYLPTFNSHVIESCLHHIPGLSEHYVYFNDDVLLLRPVKATTFFTENGLVRGFVSRATIPNGPPLEADTPSVVAIKNARSLILDETGYYLSAKFAHTYHPQLKSIALQNEKTFAEAFHICRQNKFRDTTDLLCTSFLYPCMAYVTGKGVFSRTTAWYFNIRDLAARNLYSAMLNMQGRDECPYSVCLNDHLSDDFRSEFPEYAEYLNKFMNAYYPEPTAFEKSETGSPGVNLASVTEFPGGETDDIAEIVEAFAESSPGLKAVNES